MQKVSSLTYPSKRKINIILDSVYKNQVHILKSKPLSFVTFELVQHKYPFCDNHDNIYTQTNGIERNLPWNLIIKGFRTIVFIFIDLEW